jgi:hypothetical protein
MDRKFWGSAVLVIGLLIAAWIYLSLEKYAANRTQSDVKSVVEQVDSLTNYRPAPGEHGLSLTERMHGIKDIQERPSDSLKKIIEEENLLGSENTAK